LTFILGFLYKVFLLPLLLYGLGPEKTVVGDDVCIDVTEHLGKKYSHQKIGHDFFSQKRRNFVNNLRV